MTDPSSEPLPEPPRTPRQRWLSRLAFSFFIIAAFLIWEALQVQQPRRTLDLVGGMLSLVIGFMGIRERHRRI